MSRQVDKKFLENTPEVSWWEAKLARARAYKSTKTVYGPRRDVALEWPADAVPITKQAFKDEVDINNILKRYSSKEQLLAEAAANPGRYGDFSSVPDYQDALNIVSHATEQFDGLSAALRKRFDNDPAQFLAFVSDTKTNGAEMLKLGLATPVASPEYSLQGSPSTPPAKPPKGKPDSPNPNGEEE